MQTNQKKDTPGLTPPELNSNNPQFRAYFKREATFQIPFCIKQRDGKSRNLTENSDITSEATDFDSDLKLPTLNALFVKKNDHFLKVPFGDMLWLKAEGNYTEIHTSTGKYVQTIQLSKLMSKLPNDKFMRVHRSYIINIDSITGFEGNMLLVNNSRIPVSDAYRDKVFRLFKTI